MAGKGKKTTGGKNAGEEDKTRSKKAEGRKGKVQMAEKQQQRELSLDKVIQAVPTTMFVVDKNLTVTNISEATLKALGYERDEVVGRMACKDLCNTPLCGTANCTIKRCMKTGEEIVGETTARTRDGKEIPIAACCSAIFDDDGKPVGGMEVIFDQTDQKNALLEVNNLIDAAKEGKLDQRADPEKAEGDFKKLFQDMNELLDALISPLNVAAEYIDRISKGDIPEQITDEYKGDFNEIKNNLNQCIDAVTGLVSEAGMLTEAAVAGKLDTRCEVEKFSGDYAKIVKGVNDTLDAVIGPLNVAAEYVDRISKGDIPELITEEYKGDFNEIKNNLNQCIDAVNGLVSEAGMLTEAAVEGKLDTRGDVEKFSGDYAKIVKGVNDTLDAVIGPLNVAAEYIDRISKGDIPEPITDEYKGDFNEIKNNLNINIKLNADYQGQIRGISESQAVIEFNPDGTIIHANGNFLDALEYTLDEVVGKHHSMFVDGEYGNSVEYRQFWEALNRGEAQTDEFKRFGKGGKEVWIQATYTPIKDMNGKVFKVVKYAVDVTEQKLKNADYEGQIKGINESQAVIEFNPEGIILRANDNFLDVVDYSLEEINGKHHSVFVDQEYKNSPEYGQFWEELKSGRAQVGEFKRFGKGGSEVWIQASYTPVKDQDGNVFKVVKYATDISEQKETIFLINELIDAAQMGQLDKRADLGEARGDYLKLRQGINDMLDAIIRPLNVAAEYVDRISKGDIPEPITDEYHGDFNEIKNNLNQCIDAVNGLVSEAAMLTEAAVAGKLDTRGDVEKFSGDYEKIVKGVNDTLDAVIGPLNVAAEYVDRISKGDIPKPITDEYKGDFNEIKNNLNQCIDAVNGLVSEAGMLTEAAVAGKLDTRGEVEKFSGDYAKIVNGVNDTLDAVIGPLNVAAEYVDRISKGDIPEPITDEYKGDFNEIKNNLNQCIDAVNGLVSEAGMLTEAAVAGKLDTRGDVEKFSGDYEKIVKGVNDTLDAVIGPLNVAAEYVDRISKGDIPEPITDEYKGDFNEIKNNLNQCIDAVNGLVSEAGMLTEAAVAGKLDTRGDVEKFSGDYAKIVSGVNDTLDAVIGPLNVAAEYVDRISKGDIPEPITDEYKGDFNEIKNNLNQCINAVNGLVSEAGMLTKAAVEGQLDTRGEVEKFSGDYAKIVSGVNDTLDAVIGPLNVAAEYVDRISKGDIPDPITDEYKGDFNEIKNNLNKCIEGLGGLVESNEVLQKMSVNDYTLSVEGAYMGVYADIAQAVNEVQERLLHLQRTAQNIAVGNLKDLEDFKQIGNGEGRRSENDKLVPTYIKMMESLKGLVDEVGVLAEEAVKGNLAARGDEKKFQGEFARVVKGINATLEAVINPINEAANALERIADKDLTARMKGSYKGDLAKIKEALNTAVQNLDEGLEKISLSSDQVATASGQIGAGSQAVAQGASEQASSLEEVSGNLQEMASMTKQNTANAKEAKNLSENATTTTDKGVESMNRLSEAIDKIKSSSDNTAKIVKTIDEIAFQTNLLALNAAVEAARAGDAGKGFAVVAEEVRNLAMRSAEAAKNTANMIEESVKNADNGVELNQEVIKILDEINDQNNKVSEVMTEIAAASDQQSSGIEQINTAVDQMNQVTQQNAANSEESASAAQEMSAQSEELRKLISTFKLSGINGSNINIRADQSDWRSQTSGSIQQSAGQMRFDHQKKGTPNRQSFMQNGQDENKSVDVEKVIPFRQKDDEDEAMLSSF